MTNSGVGPKMIAVLIFSHQTVLCCTVERVGWTAAVLSPDKMEESPGSTGQGAR